MAKRCARSSGDWRGWIAGYFWCVAGLAQCAGAVDGGSRQGTIALINQRQVLVAFGVLDFIDADRIDLTQGPVLQPEGDDVFHRVENLFP